MTEHYTEDTDEDEQSDYNEYLEMERDLRGE